MGECFFQLGNFVLERKISSSVNDLKWVSVFFQLGNFVVEEIIQAK